jgi:hypothetical protein
MTNRTTITARVGALAAALLLMSCTESTAPDRPAPNAPNAPSAPWFANVGMAAASGAGITLDTHIGTANQIENACRCLIKGFDNGNPRRGDAIIATFFWVSATTTNIIDSVTDVTNDANFTPVGNTYHLVRFVHSGNLSMATYVATNIQNFPDPNATPRLAVRASLSETVADGGLQLSAWSGVASDFTQAIGASNAASGSGTAYTADPGAIDIAAGALAYGVSLVSRGGDLLDAAPPPEFTILNVLSDAFLVDEANYLVSNSARSVDPQWQWTFNQPSTWLATVLVLNPPPVLAFTVQPHTTMPLFTIQPAVQVTVLDAFGNRIPTFTGPVTIAIGHNGGVLAAGTLSGTKTVNAVNGVATFSDLSIDQLGNGYTLVVSGAGLTGAESAVFNIGAF